MTLKVRIISSIGGLVILFSVLAFYGTIVPNIAVSIIAIIGVDEMLEASGIIRNIPLSVTAFIFAGIMPFYNYFGVVGLLPMICLVFLLIFFAILLKEHNNIRVEQLAFTFFMTGLISISLSLFMVMRDRFGIEMGLFGAFIVFVSSWMSDTGAYFAGVLFGKHKLAPIISPKKTVEGAIGGVIVGLAGLVLGSYIFSAYTSYMFGWNIEVNYLYIALVSPILTAISIMGDLSASVIKRQFNIKDFGKIMPGHGGVLDRFDSVLLVCPVVYFLMSIVPPIVVR